MTCTVCEQPLLRATPAPVVLYLCWHAAHVACVGRDTPQVAAPAFPRPVETTTSQSARERRSWIGTDPLAPMAPPQRPERLVWSQAHAQRERADRKTLARARARQRHGGQQGCPTCAAAHADTLYD